MMPGTVEFFKNYLSPVFVETGSHIGEGIMKALVAGFPAVRSIDAGDKQYQHCLNRFKNEPRVKLWKGDSAYVLKDMISDLTFPVTFWLDGHYSAGDTCKCEHEQPLLFELKQIAEHPVKNHFILIDDWRDYNFHEPQIREFAAKILDNPSYTKVGDIFIITPSKV
jgi:hypothetical protein